MSENVIPGSEWTKGRDRARVDSLFDRDGFPPMVRCVNLRTDQFWTAPVRQLVAEWQPAEEQG